MKKSIFTQQFEVTGTKRKVTGEIIVTMNAHSQVAMAPAHQVQSKIMGETHELKPLLLTEEAVLEAVQQLKISLLKSMQDMADNNTITFLSKMKELGFNV